MKIVLQRVKEAEVVVDGRTVGKIGRGLLLLIGFEKGDTEEGFPKIAEKIVNLRIFDDEEGKMNLSLLDLKLEILAVSNFTLAGDTRKGRRPSFDKAERPDRALELYKKFVGELKKFGVKVEEGVFGARMEVKLVNDGPVTFIL
jgi:D-tyrosyl-tRNA(Tyr) deacylase